MTEKLEGDFTHFDNRGRVKMIDVGNKPKSDRRAVAAATVLINQETYLLGRQLSRLAADFEHEGGFSERLYRVRSEARAKNTQ